MPHSPRRVALALCVTGLTALASPCADASSSEPEVIPGRIFGRSIVSLNNGAWRHVRVRNVGGQFVLSQRDSSDFGRTWSAYTDVLALPDNEFGTAIGSGLDKEGEFQSFLVRKRDFDPPGVPGVDRFLDLYQTRSSAGQSQWNDPPQLLFEGWVGQIMTPTTLPSGRIVMPFHSAVRDRVEPTGASVSTVAWSDDRGATWQVSTSRLTAPVSADFNGSLDGAVEPIVIDQSRFGDPAIERQWMLLRTQTDRLYESYSHDDGETWSDATPSMFPSSNSAASSLWLPDRDGDGDEELILFWNNTRNSPRYEGQGVYSGRDAIHAAISGDGGRTWTGFREVYLDPTRHDTPPTAGDRGTANPFALPMSGEDRVALLTGNGPAAATVLVDPDFLFETRRDSDFSDGLDGWSAFTHVGPASGFWRDRVVGPQLVDDPDQPGNTVMHLNNPEPRLDQPGGQDGDGATWNFPLGRRGRIDIRMRITGDTKVADIQLTDRFLDPADDTSLDVAVFHVRFNSRGELADNTSVKISPDQWHDVSIAWDLNNESATLLIDGDEAATLPMLYDTPTGGLSYLRLRSPFVRALDPAGWMVDRVSVTVPEPGAEAVMLIGTGAVLARRVR